MTLLDELIKLAVSIFGITLLGGAVTAFWTWRQKRREIEEMELKAFYKHYGQLLTSWRLWNTIKSTSIAVPPGEATRYELLKQVSEAESAVEGMLLKLASERSLSRHELSILGSFRQGCQTVRESIHNDEVVPWHCSEEETYMAFKKGASFFSSLLKNRIWSFRISHQQAMKAVEEITSNKNEFSRKAQAGPCEKRWK